MKSAFTLIELLVVIAIIAILAAILFPVFAQAKAAAKQTGDLSALHQLGTAVEMYATDVDDHAFPLYYTEPSTSGMPILRRWPMLTMPYVKSHALFFSPADGEGQAFLGRRGGTDWDYLFGLSPSWGYNQTLYAPENLQTNVFEGISLTALDRPAESMLLASSIWATNATSPKTGYYRVYPPAEWAGSIPLNGLSFGHVWPRFRGTHVGLLYGDSHVRALALDAVRTKTTLWTGRE